MVRLVIAMIAMGGDDEDAYKRKRQRSGMNKYEAKLMYKMRNRLLMRSGLTTGLVCMTMKDSAQGEAEERRRFRSAVLVLR